MSAAKRQRLAAGAGAVMSTTPQLETLAHSVAQVYPLVEICNRNGCVVKTVAPALAKDGAGPKSVIAFLNETKRKGTSINIANFHKLINFNSGYRHLHSFYENNDIFPSFVLDVRSPGTPCVRDVTFIHSHTTFLNVYPFAKELETPPPPPAVGSISYGFVVTGGPGVTT